MYCGQVDKLMSCMKKLEQETKLHINSIVSAKLVDSLVLDDVVNSNLPLLDEVHLRLRCNNIFCFSVQIRLNSFCAKTQSVDLEGKPEKA